MLLFLFAKSRRRNAAGKAGNNMKGNYSCGLVLEGGGNRAIYTSGVLDAFIEAGIEFPYVIGVSAGSCNAVSFLGKNLRRQHDIVINYCNDKRYMSLGNLFKRKPMLNLDWIFNELSYDIMPLNQDEFEASGTTLCVAVTNAYSGKAEYLYPKNMRTRGCLPLKASCALPIATKGVQIGADTYFDGGIADSIPLKKALDDGCRKAVVILTQDRDYVKHHIDQEKAVHKMLRQYPKIADALLARDKMYNAQKAYVAAEEKAGNCFVIAPAADLGCGTMERNLTKLERIYQLGYAQGRQKAAAVKEFMAAAAKEQAAASPEAEPENENE